MQKQQKERLKGMIKSLDVPDGYTVVMVQTGLNDGTYVEIKEIKGSLKEGDTILIPAVVGNTGTQMQGGMAGGGMYGGRMPGGGMTGGRMPTGGMTGGRMPTGGMTGGRMPSGGMSGGMGTSRTGASGAARTGGGMR